LRQGFAASIFFKLSRDKNFKEELVELKTSKATTIIRLSAWGRYYWQVTGAGNSKSAIFPLALISAQQSQRRATLPSVSNTVYERDRHTIISFQGSKPKLQFQWSKKSQAVSYLLEIGTDPQLYTKLFSNTTSHENWEFTPDFLPEGTYYWRIQSLDAQNQVTQTGKIRRLELSFDNVVPRIQIISPRENAGIEDPRIEITGVAQSGSQLFINKQNVPLDKGGKFKHWLDLKPGANLVVYKIKTLSGKIYYHLQTLTMHQ